MGTRCGKGEIEFKLMGRFRGLLILCPMARHLAFYYLFSLDPMYLDAENCLLSAKKWVIVIVLQSFKPFLSAELDCCGYNTLCLIYMLVGKGQSKTTDQLGRKAFKLAVVVDEDEGFVVFVQLNSAEQAHQVRATSRPR